MEGASANHLCLEAMGRVSGWETIDSTAILVSPAIHRRACEQGNSYMAKKKKAPVDSGESKKPAKKASSAPAKKKAAASPVKKTTGKAASAKSAVTKKAAPASKAKKPAAKAKASKSAATKASASKAPAKKAAAKPAAPAKAASSAKKKATAAKAPAKKAAAPKKATPAKKTSGRKPAATSKKRTVAKKAAQKLAPLNPSLSPANVSAGPTRHFSPVAFREIEDDERELPLEYDDTKVVAMIRDPEWIFVYWEISNDLREARGLTRGSHERLLCLRVFALTDAEQEVSEEYFDVPVNDYTSSWYVRVPMAADWYRIELGTIEDGEFVTIALSNSVGIPRRQIADETGAEFAEINDEIFGQIVELSGGLQIRERLGSDEFLKSLQQRVFNNLSEGPFSSAGLTSSSLFGGLSSGAMYGLSSAVPSSWVLSSSSMVGGSSSYMVDQQESVTHRKVDKQRGFWLEVGVDVIVYGATEPDAKVSFMGREIQLTPDGTFRFRMVLPDSEIQFPIEAVSSDGEETRRVKPVVERHTEGDPHKPA